jgi:hypothetical protein
MGRDPKESRVLSLIDEMDTTCCNDLYMTFVRISDQDAPPD